MLGRAVKCNERRRGNSPSDQYSAELVPGRRERMHTGGAGYGGPVLIVNMGRCFHETLKALNMKQRPSVCSFEGGERTERTAGGNLNKKRLNRFVNPVRTTH